ncbi:FAD-binding protein [Rhodococcus sp. PvR099]|uniref:FAD-binding protein n=1 Tax=Rhodococcus sp. PvR099 TaxID=2806602 RepID=UPI001AE6EED1|nr:FAD-binding protein [Rhodococcus sp. PvR099]MBP1160799.1 3-oxo-5alpha-steroid 4-dehydrogenase [Rhodococcus sp. PvR099]
MSWDLSADVVVVGVGVAGVSAALEAVAAGADVIALDRYSGGGASTISGGIVYAGGGTWVQKQAGVADSSDAMFAYLSREVGDAVSEETLRKFCDQSPAMIDWLSGHGVPFEASLCPYKTSYPSNRHYLYYSGSEAAGGFRDIAKPAPRGHRAKGKGTSGKMLYGPLIASALTNGVRLEQQSRATELIMDETGTVVGVQCLSLRGAPKQVRARYAALTSLSAKPGIYYPPMRKILQKQIEKMEARYAKPIRIQARSGVVLSAGGFIANRELVAEHAPQYRGGLALGTAGDDGSGIQMGTAVGAATDKLSNISAWRFIVPPSAFLSSVLVNEKGNRMVDESRYGAALGYAMIAENSGQGWLLADADLVKEARSQLGTQTMWFQRVQAETLLRGEGVTGNTLEEVAAKVGIDAAGLAATVAAHNDAIAAGEADPMGKPADFVRPVRTAPFSLFDVSLKKSLTNPLPMLTLGGLVVDESTGEVTSTAGEAIPGLYAAGRTAVGICSNSYVSGLSLADCIYSGRRAGAHAAQGGSA